MWNWYEWNSLEEFNTWHQLIKNQLGYPLASYNQATGELTNEEAVKDYTSAMLIDDKWIAFVETKHSEGLSQTDKRPPIKPINSSL